jgi:hypothetical protein
MTTCRKKGETKYPLGVVVKCATCGKGFVKVVGSYELWKRRTHTCGEDCLRAERKRVGKEKGKARRGPRKGGYNTSGYERNFVLDEESPEQREIAEQRRMREERIRKRIHAIDVVYNQALRCHYLGVRI